MKNKRTTKGFRFFLSSFCRFLTEKVQVRYAYRRRIRKWQCSKCLEKWKRSFFLFLLFIAIFAPINQKTCINHMKERIIYLDYLKALAIFLVIIYHSHAYDALVMPPVLSMCVAIFFAVNGYLMLVKKRTYKELLAKNMKIIFLVFFWGILRSAFQFLVLGGDLVPKAIFSNFLEFKVGYGNYLWFLVALFILNLINPLVHAFVHHGSRSDKIVFCVLLFLFSASFIRTLSWKFNPLRNWYHYESVFYYVAGFFAINYSKRVKWPWHYCSLVVLGFYLVQLIENCLFMHPSFTLFRVVDYVFFNFGSMWVMGETLALIVLFSKLKLRHNHFVEYVGSHTLGIYLLQDFFCSVTRNMMPNDYVYAYPPLVLLLCIAVLWLFEKNKFLRWIVTF